MRLRLDLAYDGTGFRGWAVQPDQRTVQGLFEAALATVLRVDAVSVTCAGRTDAGVHARGQVVHFDVEEQSLLSSAGRGDLEPVEALLRRLNGILPLDVRVRAGMVAPPGFDARFSALWRRYCYRIADRFDLVDPMMRHQVVSWPRALDVDVLNEASESLLGLRDFAAFCKKREGATTIRTLQELRWDRNEVGVVEATVRADAFCHNMVRSLVGCVTAIGEGRRPVAWAVEILEGKARDAAVAVSPAHGLTLEEVAYPPDDELARRARVTRGRRTDG